MPHKHDKRSRNTKTKRRGSAWEVWTGPVVVATKKRAMRDLSQRERAYRLVRLEFVTVYLRDGSKSWVKPVQVHYTKTGRPIKPIEPAGGRLTIRTYELYNKDAKRNGRFF